MRKPIEQVQSSELSRNPLKVFSAAEKAPVTVTRRDGEDLVLMSKRERKNLAEFHTYISQVLAAVDDQNGSLVDRMSKPFPWVLALRPEGQIDCVRELLRTAKAAMALGTPDLALHELYSWRTTAENLALGVKVEDVEWLDKPIPVPRP
jgi:prevent-host-death family protein